MYAQMIKTAGTGVKTREEMTPRGSGVSGQD